MKTRVVLAIMSAVLPALALLALTIAAPPQYRLVIEDSLARGWPVVWATAALLVGMLATCAMFWQRGILSLWTALAAVSPLAATTLCCWMLGGFAIGLVPAILLVPATPIVVMLARRGTWMPIPPSRAWLVDAAAAGAVLVLFLGFAIASAANPIVTPRTVGALAILTVFLASLGVILCNAVFHPRIGAVVGAWWLLAAFILAPNDHTVPTRPAVTETVGVEQALRQWLSQRRDLDVYRQARMPYPVIFVSSEGGGIYAAAHAHAVLSTLAARCPTFSQHVLVAVGVSGGAVGNALFHAAADTAQKPAAPCAPGNTRLDQSALTADHLSPVLARMLLLETLDSFLPGQWITRDRGGVLVDSFRASMANDRSLEHRAFNLRHILQP